MTRVRTPLAGDFRRHPLHDPSGPWPQTDCYLDVWISVLHGLGLDPVPALAPVLALSADDDQLTFVKTDERDLRELYGIRYGEHPLWVSLLEHVVTQAEAGHLLVVEADSFYLPDTAGTSYRTEHLKSSIVPVELDPDAQVMTYLHNNVQGQLCDDDFAAIFRSDALTGEASTWVPLPYVERVDLSGLQRLSSDELAEAARAVAVRQLADSTAAPLGSLPQWVDRHGERMAREGMPFFHRFAFATTRPAGFAAHLAGALASWFGERGADPVASREAASAFEEASGRAQQAQLKLTRVARGRSVDVEALATAYDTAWSTGIDRLGAALR
ncbi:DUF1839 family protein [Calidifontibacter sp. DB0510]|uniref:DUF1839 family protein n=1 Tax=Metallococcus carri TaxID=1656884 RepID=A0A967B248_9MICO|nr:DUF1839 family protein [Metallococcus carri]NHN56587.1 DUF1839 family protein [Metallococcus carri]NOP38886.1 DUF1839 family protein [Calidifontibacter sp. DB2511S]